MFLSILTFTFDLTLGSFLTFWGPNGLFLGLRKGLNTVSGSTHVVEKLSFSMFFFSILTFDFESILGSFLSFWGPVELFLGSGKGSNTVLGSTHVVEQLSFSMLSSFLIFDFYLILGSLFSFWGPKGLFGGLGRVQQLIWGLLM